MERAVEQCSAWYAAANGPAAERRDRVARSASLFVWLFGVMCFNSKPPRHFAWVVEASWLCGRPYSANNRGTIACQQPVFMRIASRMRQAYDARKRESQGCKQPHLSWTTQANIFAMLNTCVGRFTRLVPGQKLPRIGLRGVATQAQSPYGIVQMSGTRLVVYYRRPHLCAT